MKKTLVELNLKELDTLIRSVELRQSRLEKMINEYNDKYGIHCEIDLIQALRAKLIQAEGLLETAEYEQDY